MYYEYFEKSVVNIRQGVPPVRGTGVGYNPLTVKISVFSCDTTLNGFFAKT
jgi:hypothetical protein